MDFFLRFDFWLAVIGAVFIFRQLSIVLSAEHGRQHDLVKKLYKVNQDFHISVLVPVLHSEQAMQLAGLLEAIDAQEYPTDKISVHLAAPESVARLLTHEARQQRNVKIWTCPTPPSGFETAITWLIERCLAAGGSGLFVFLKPGDLIKPDFFQNVVARGFDSFVIQGYVAQRNFPQNPMAKVMALSTRLINRIGNAGRHHMGLSCRLLDSGWAIKQEVLEMIPYHRGRDLDNLEYTLRLNLENFRVNWAPNVVVYSDGQVNFLNHLTDCVAAFFNRLGLLMQYGPKLLVRAALRLDANYLEQVYNIVKPPHFVPGAVLAALAILSWQNVITLPGSPITWAVLAGFAVALHVFSLFVARCKPVDYVVLFFWTPVVYALGIACLPIALVNYLTASLRGAGSQHSDSYRTLQKTRFNEELEPMPSLFDDELTRANIHSLLEDEAHQSEDALEKSGYASIPREPVTTGGGANTPTISRLRPPREQVKSVPLSNGSKQVDCTLKTLTTFDAEGRESHQLTLEYKSLSFSTASYRILDQAFYELQTKLMGKGFTIMTCGSCGNFFNPTADLPGALKNAAGVCLFGKRGREVDLNTDAVTVVSQSCAHHCALTERENIVRQWKESLFPASRLG